MKTACFARGSECALANAGALAGPTQTFSLPLADGSALHGVPEFTSFEN